MSETIFLSKIFSFDQTLGFSEKLVFFNYSKFWLFKVSIFGKITEFSQRVVFVLLGQPVI